MSADLQLSQISKSYGETVALDQVTLSVAADSYVALLGSSGSGKTTLLRLIAGFEEAEAGSIVFDGQRLDGTPAHKRGIGFVFQNFALFPHLSVAKNIAFGLENREEGPIADPAEVARRVGDMIELVGLTGLADRGVGQISGGQRQRVALARTLVTEPRLVLLDEPLGALDANLRARMRAELRAIRARLGVSFLHVTGSETEALAMGDQVIVLDAGRVAQVSDPDTLYSWPASPAVARYLNCYNLFAGQIEGERFATKTGALPLGDTARRQASGQPTYAIRNDLIAIREPDQEPKSGEALLPAHFVASEYSGASLLSLFELAGGQIVEVETHLSHGKPQQYRPRAPYTLVWNSSDALLFA